jgi:hypothetical protein
MRDSIILAIVEPLKFSLDQSLAWDLTQRVRTKQHVSVLDAAGQSLAIVTEVLPLLQPIRARLESQRAFILMMRVTVDRTVSSLSRGGSLADSQGHTLASVLSASGGGAATQLAIAPNFAAVASADISALRLYLEQMAGELWSQEPVSWTTHALQLASTGEFLAGKEMLSRNLLGGEIVASNGVISILQGAKPRTIPYRPWSATQPRGARSAVSGSGEDCTCDGGSSEGGDWGSGSGDVGDNAGGSGGIGGGGGSGGGDSGAVGGCGGGALVAPMSKINPNC